MLEKFPKAFEENLKDANTSEIKEKEINEAASKKPLLDSREGEELKKLTKKINKETPASPETNTGKTRPEPEKSSEEQYNDWDKEMFGDENIEAKSDEEIIGKVPDVSAEQLKEPAKKEQTEKVETPETKKIIDTLYEKEKNTPVNQNKIYSIPINAFTESYSDENKRLKRIQKLSQLFEAKVQENTNREPGKPKPYYSNQAMKYLKAEILTEDEKTNLEKAADKELARQQSGKGEGPSVSFRTSPENSLKSLFETLPFENLKDEKKENKTEPPPPENLPTTEELSEKNEDEIEKAVALGEMNPVTRKEYTQIKEKVEESPTKEKKEESKLLSNTRKKYASLDIDKKEKGGEKWENAKKEYLETLQEHRKTLYEESVKELEKEGLSKEKIESLSKEKLQEIAKITLLEEANNLYDAKTDLKLETKTGEKIEKIKNMASKIVDRYRKMPTYQKLLISAGLFAGGVATGAAAGATGAALASGLFVGGRKVQRLLGGAATAVGLESLIKRAQEKKAEKKTMEELYKKADKLEAFIKKGDKQLDEKLLKLEGAKKRQKYWRYSLAGAVGTTIAAGMLGKAIKHAPEIWEKIWSDEAVEKIDKMVKPLLEKAGELKETISKITTPKGPGFIPALDNPEFNEPKIQESVSETKIPVHDKSEVSHPAELTEAEKGGNVTPNATQATETEVAKVEPAPNATEVTTDATEFVERGVKADFVMELGKNGIPTQPERVFQMLALDHMEEITNGSGTFAEEQATKSLNIAANLVRLSEGKDTIGIDTDKLKEVFTLDQKTGVLEIKNHKDFNQLLDKLEKHSDGLWEKGTLQKGATAYIDDIKKETWEKIIHADNIDKVGDIETGIAGHDEITTDKITDFEKSEMVKQAEEITQKVEPAPNATKVAPSGVSAYMEGLEKHFSEEIVKTEPLILSEVAKNLLYENIGFNQEEYTAIQNITIAKFLEEIPDLKTDGQISAYWHNEVGPKSIDLPHGGNAYDYGEFKKQVLLGQTLRTELPTDTIPESTTIDEFLKNNIKDGVKMPETEIHPEKTVHAPEVKEEIPQSPTEETKESEPNDWATETKPEPQIEGIPEKFIYKEIGFNKTEFAAIQDISVSELLEEIPEDLDTDAKIEEYFNSEKVNLPFSEDKYELSEFKKQVALSNAIRQEIEGAIPNADIKATPNEYLNKTSIKQFVSIMTLSK